jgi:hypothetical protein
MTMVAQNRDSEGGLSPVAGLCLDLHQPGVVLDGPWLREAVRARLH